MHGFRCMTFPSRFLYFSCQQIEYISISFTVCFHMYHCDKRTHGLRIKLGRHWGGFNTILSLILASQNGFTKCWMSPELCWRCKELKLWKVILSRSSLSSSAFKDAGRSVHQQLFKPVWVPKTLISGWHWHKYCTQQRPATANYSGAHNSNKQQQTNKLSHLRVTWGKMKIEKKY